MSEQALSIACGKRSDNGTRLVVAAMNGHQHRDTFDTNSAWRREAFRAKTVGKFNLPEVAHEYLEGEILAKADAADSADAAPVESPIIKPASEYKLETVEWLWTGYVPAAAVTIVDGDPGLGKSQLTCWLAAAVTTHRTMPDGSGVPVRRPRGVVMLSAEDDPNRTMRPRLDAVGADCDRVHFFAGIECFDGTERGFTLPRDVELLERVVAEQEVALVVIDPFVAYLDGSLSMNSDADVRRALKPLSAMAERTGAAVVMLRHLNKRGDTSSMYRGGGSIGIIGAARAAYVVAKREEDPTCRVMAPVKMNLAKPPRSLEFSIESHGSTSRLAWGNVVDDTADSLLVREKASQSKVDAASEIIRRTLANGPRGEREVMGACSDVGISRSTYKRARRELGVRSEKTGFAGEWLLSLPDCEGAQSHT